MNEYLIIGADYDDSGARNFYNGVAGFNEYRRPMHNTKDLNNLSAFSDVRRKNRR